MVGVKTVPIKELYLGLYDGPHATPKPSDDGPVFLGIGNVTDDGRLDLSTIRHIAEEDFAQWTKRVEPRPNDLVFTYEATLNRYAVIPEGFRGCLGRRMALIRTDPRRVDHRWLHYYFFSPAWREVIKSNMLSGSTVDRIPLTTFPEYPVNAPSLPTQRRIADILSAYDELIANNQRRIAVLEEMARALYREWFVYYRAPGVVMGEDGMPEGWGLGKLEDVITLQRGFDLPKADRVDGAVPIIAATGVTGYHCEAKVKGPGVVTGRSGTIGEVLYIQEDYWPLNTTLWSKAFQRAMPLFAYYTLSGIDLGQFNAGAAVPSLNRNDIHGLPVIIPPMDLQVQFQSIAGVMLDQVEASKRTIENLRRTRDLLLPRLMSGRVEVEKMAV